MRWYVGGALTDIKKKRLICREIYEKDFLDTRGTIELIIIYVYNNVSISYAYISIN